MCQDHVGLQGDQLFREMRRLLREGGKAARAQRGTLSWKIWWSAITQALNHIDRVVAADISEGEIDCAQASNSY